MTTPYIYKVMQVNVLRGDTMELTIDLGFEQYLGVTMSINGVMVPNSIDETEITAGEPVRKAVQLFMRRHHENNGHWWIRSEEAAKLGETIVVGGDIYPTFEDACNCYYGNSVKGFIHNTGLHLTYHGNGDKVTNLKEIKQNAEVYLVHENL